MAIMLNDCMLNHIMSNDILPNRVDQNTQVSTTFINYLANFQITVAFQYAWLDEMFKEMATYVFFVLTGYKFRPVSQNPYFSMHDVDDDDDDEVEM